MNETKRRKTDKPKGKRLYRQPFGLTMLYAGEGAVIGCMVCWLCYNDIRSLPLAGLIAAVFCVARNRARKQKQKRLLLYHFKDFISSLHTALRAGYSVENGVVSAVKDIEMLYGSEDLLFRELRDITAGLKVQKRVEELFFDLGERSDLSDIKMFAELLAVGKKTGGNMNRLLTRISQILCDRIDTKQEIDAQLASRVFEQRIMSLMPACMIVYLRLTFPGFIETLYGNLFGAGMMSTCLAVYAGAFVWGKKIVSIEVF